VNNIPFGTHLAIEQLKTDYNFFIVGALEGEGADLTVRVFSSLDFLDTEIESGPKKVITKELAEKIILHLQPYVIQTEI